ncbi:MULTISPECIES: Hsp20/alpha crystallin family protein [Streptomyces]|uniref:Hsp20/alpha crystallin family protein n=1 Tax=Streptomyces TaxID=1883 RepID=UPI000A361A73|nr:MULTISPECIES: Hsp20/alpha crystallin family protein [Streptomyces]MDX3633429.1 Hsp20/alpha crystallin family protein [Streptomyces europaeiscabiei]MDX3650665.1 Hsp20/alpha crystallin family protein [Streptomyces europaeiscabiei]WRZ53722.1 Hsp20/alpha crystallin family protein [Streptomyces sp. NBC_01314]
MTLPVRRSRSAVPAWDPFRELEDLHSRMDRLMQSAFPGAGEFGTPEAWAPLAEVEDTEDAYLVELELPGVSKDQITVEVANGELDVHGKIKEKERTGVVRRHTRHIGQFDYRTSLPPNSDPEHISADLTDGVLTVRVPKAEKSKPQRIEISG